jgi:hypothetical protein
MKAPVDYHVVLPAAAELEERIAKVRDDFQHATEGPPHPRYYEYDGQGITPF